MLLIKSGNLFQDQKFSTEGPSKDPINVNDKFKVMRISLKKGLAIEKHLGSHPVFFLVLKGKGIFTAGDKEIELGENEFISLTSDEARGIKSLEDLVVLAVRDWIDLKTHNP